MENVLDQDIGLTYGLINEYNNQQINASKKRDEEEVIYGDAKMLMNM